MWKKLEVVNETDKLARLLGISTNNEHYSIFEGDINDEDGAIQVFGAELAQRVVDLLNADDADAELTAPSKDLQVSDNPDTAVNDDYWTS